MEGPTPVTRPATGAGPAGPASAPALSPGVRRPRRILLAVVVVAVLAELAGFTGTYLGYSRHYVSTDDAQVDGDQVTIAAPISGTVTAWDGTEGTIVRAHQVVGRIVPGTGRRQPRHTVIAPGAGTITVSNTVEGQYVQAGYPLAVAYDPGRSYVTARLDETAAGRVRVDQPVDITVDAYPGRHLSGVVEVIQNSTAGEFSPYPSPDIDPTNPQREQEYVPVRVAFTGTGGLALAPGLNATVHIRTDR